MPSQKSKREIFGDIGFDRPGIYKWMIERRKYWPNKDTLKSGLYWRYYKIKDSDEAHRLKRAIGFSKRY